MFKTLSAAVVALVASASVASAADTVKIAWSHYTGWEPLGYMQESGIMAKWNEKMGTDVQIELVNDYVESVTQYAAGQFQGVSVTNMDVLAIAGVSGRHSTALIVGDYSNGNDGLVLKGYDSLKEVDTVNLVEYSVSHYLLARCASKLGASLDQFTLINTTDADIPAVVEQADKIAAVSWNPMLMGIKAQGGGAEIVCDSSKIPGEIIDMVVVGDEVDEASRKALVGAWYETMALMAAGADGALGAMAEQAGSSLDDFKAQLTTTKMFYEPAEAVAFTSDWSLKATMNEVAKFSHKVGIYTGIEDPKQIGIKYADGSVVGAADNVMLSFDTTVATWASGL